MKRKWVACLMAALCSVFLAGPAYASGLEGYNIPEITAQNQQQTSAIVDSNALNWFYAQSQNMTMNSSNMMSWLTNAALLQNMSANLNASQNAAEPISQSMGEVYGEVTGEEVNVSQKPMYDMGNVSASFDTGALNLQYEALASTMNAGYAEALPSGLSGNVMDLFQNNFGDITNGLSLEVPTIPDSFDPANMISTMQNSISSSYSGAMSTGLFKTVNDNISIGSVFARANSGLNSSLTDGLLSSDSIGALLSSYSASQKSAIGSEYANSHTTVYSYADKAKSSAVKNCKSAFDGLGVSFAFFNSDGSFKSDADISAQFEDADTRANKAEQRETEELRTRLKTGDYEQGKWGDLYLDSLNVRNKARTEAIQTRTVGDVLGYLGKQNQTAIGIDADEFNQRKKEQEVKVYGSKSNIAPITNTVSEPSWPDSLNLNPV